MTPPLDHLANHSCTDCPLHKGTSRVCVMGDGDIKSEVMIIGEAPGGNEEYTGRVFSGRAGEVLDLHLKEAGLPRSRVYVTNVVKCRPSENHKPSRLDWEACAQYLQAEIEAIDPKYILLLGNTAMQAVVKKSGITKQRGLRLKPKNPLYDRREVTATIHPAYVLRNPGQTTVFGDDIKRFVRLTRNEMREVHVKGIMVQTPVGLRKLRLLLQEAPDGTVLSYDVETRFRPWEKDWSIICLGLTLDGRTSYVVPLYHPESPFRHNWKKVLTYLKPALERPGIKRVAQNGKFDNVQLAGAGVYLEHSFDIMLAAHILDENRPKNLGYLSQSILGADEYKGMVETKPDKILKEPIRKLARYNAMDAGYTWQLRPPLLEDLKREPRLLRLFSKLIMPASHVIQQVEYRGIYMDQERLYERMHQLQGMIDEKKAVLYEHLPKKLHEDFNFNSPQQLSRWLFSSTKRGGLGLSPLERTPTGNLSTKEGVLLHYRDNPAIAALLRYRTLQLKWMNTYLLPWSLQLDANSRRHTIYSIYGTVTGRLSGDFQQTPRDPFIRSVVGAPPGWLFVQADYSQVELRIAAHCAHERRMQRAFLMGEDIHAKTASNLLGKEPSELTKEERKKAKAVNFGFLYGMYPKKFQAYAFEKFDLELSIAEATAYRKRYFEMYPQLLSWHDHQKRVAGDRHRVSSPIGRIRHLPDILSSDNGVRMEAERQAINSPVQSMASDLMLFSMVQLQPLLNSGECVMVGTLHDAIFFEVREDCVDKYKPLIKETMENLPLEKTFGCELSVPIVSEVDVGTHWGEWVV